MSNTNTSHLFEQIQNALRQQESLIRAHMQEAFSSDSDMQPVRQAADRIDQIRDLIHRTQQLAEEVAETLMENSQERGGGWCNLSPTKQNRPLRKIEIELTEGMIRQKLLTVTEAIKARLLRRNEKLAILLPNGRKLETEICQPGNRLRARGAVGRIYEEHQLKPGDRVLLLEQYGGDPWVLGVQKSEKTGDNGSLVKEPSALTSASVPALNPSNSTVKPLPLP